MVKTYEIYKMECRVCGKIFHCTGQCKHIFAERLTNETCVCYKCDHANELWKKDCGKDNPKPLKQIFVFR
jgi:hypothetical protein